MSDHAQGFQRFKGGIKAQGTPRRRKEGNIHISTSLEIRDFFRMASRALGEVIAIKRGKENQDEFVLAELQLPLRSRYLCSH